VVTEFDNSKCEYCRGRETKYLLVSTMNEFAPIFVCEECGIYLRLLISVDNKLFRVRSKITYGKYPNQVEVEGKGSVQTSKSEEESLVYRDGLKHYLNKIGVLNETKI